MMRDDIEARIRLCYPSEIWEIFDEKQANYEWAEGFWKGLPALLETHAFACDKPNVWSENERTVEFEIRRKNDQSHWYFNDDKAAKVEKLRLNNKPFVSIRANVSTVIPAYYLYITEYWFDPATYGANARGKYDDGIRQVSWLNDTKSAPWATLISSLRTYAETIGLERLDNATLDEIVPFVTSPVFEDTDDDDSLDTDDDRESLKYLKSLAQNRCDVFDCLFSIGHPR